MKIQLIYVTRTGPVDTGVHLHFDDHIDLAYRLVQSGMLGLTAKKHWCFAHFEGKNVVSSIPMYIARQVKGGTTQWVPRIAEKQVRGSFRVVYEVLTEMRSVQNTQALREALREKDEPEVPVVGTEPSPDGDLTRQYTEAYEAWEARGDGTPPPEIQHYPDGTKQLILTWKQVDPLVSQAAVDIPQVFVPQDADADQDVQEIASSAEILADIESAQQRGADEDVS